MDHPNRSPTPPTPTPNYVSETAFFLLSPPSPIVADSPLPPAPEDESPKAHRGTRIRVPTWKVRESLLDPITFPPDSGIPPGPPQPTENRPA